MCSPLCQQFPSDITCCRHSANSPRYFLIHLLMGLLEYNSKMHQKRATIDVLLLCYRAYTRRIRKMLYLGGVLHDQKHSVIWSYITSFLVIFVCFGQCILVMNFCRDHTDNLVLLSKCFGLTCSFITPVLMVSHV